MRNGPARASTSPRAGSCGAQKMADDDEPALDNIVEEVADELGEALANIKPKSPSASISWPVTEAELAHYEEIMETLKSRWSGITAEAKVKMTIVNEDSVQREESTNEFKATWACHATSDGTLTREKFCVFNHKHLSNSKARLGWAPDLTKVDSERIWEAIHALNPDVSGISLADYSRYHAVMKNYID